MRSCREFTASGGYVPMVKLSGFDFGFGMTEGKGNGKVSSYQLSVVSKKQIPCGNDRKKGNGNGNGKGKGNGNGNGNGKGKGKGNGGS
jgi:hypothetical protein